MPDILVRGLDGYVVNRLKAVAKQHGKSLQSEVKTILTQAVPFSRKEAIERSHYWLKKLSGRKQSDSTALIREDRDR